MDPSTGFTRNGRPSHKPGDGERRRKYLQELQRAEEEQRRAKEEERQAQDAQRKAQEAQRKALNAQRKAMEDVRKAQEAQRKAQEDRQRASAKVLGLQNVIAQIYQGTDDAVMDESIMAPNMASYNAPEKKANNAPYYAEAVKQVSANGAHMGPYAGPIAEPHNVPTGNFVPNAVPAYTPVQTGQFPAGPYGGPYGRPYKLSLPKPNGPMTPLGTPRARRTRKRASA